jgi:hypothetical protein
MNEAFIEATRNMLADVTARLGKMRSGLDALSDKVKAAELAEETRQEIVADVRQRLDVERRRNLFDLVHTFVQEQGGGAVGADLAIAALREHGGRWSEAQQAELEALATAIGRGMRWAGYLEIGDADKWLELTNNAGDAE